MQIVLSAGPGDAPAAACRLAHAAYRIGPDSTLLRNNQLQAKGGLLSVSDRNAPAVADPEALCAAIARECARRNYCGAVLDFEEHPRPDLLRFAGQLGPVLARNRRTLYLPEAYADASRQAVFLICTAVSGGNLRERLQEAAGHWGGAGRLALDLQRLRMDFPLPCPSGVGTPLSREELEALKARESPAVFFSPDLCARYFTYTRDGRTHFVLFDDADTLAQKRTLGASMGFSAGFFAWPEVQDIAGALGLLRPGGAPGSRPL